MLALALLAGAGAWTVAEAAPEPAAASAVKKKNRKKKSTGARKKAKKSSSSSKRKSSSGRRRTSSSAARTGSADYTLPAEPVATPVAPSRVKDSNLRKLTVGKPDLDAIRKATLDPSHKYYFPKLMARYQRNDTTMTASNMRLLSMAL